MTVITATTTVGSVDGHDTPHQKVLRRNVGIEELIGMNDPTDERNINIEEFKEFFEKRSQIEGHKDIR